MVTVTAAEKSMTLDHLLQHPPGHFSRESFVKAVTVAFMGDLFEPGQQFLITPIKPPIDLVFNRADLLARFALIYQPCQLAFIEEIGRRIPEPNDWFCLVVKWRELGVVIDAVIKITRFNSRGDLHFAL